MSEDILVPPGTRLLHIGPQKTATTAVQNAFHVRRDVLARYGVHYAGPVQHSSLAIKSFAGRTPPHRRADPERRRWKALLQEIHDAGDQRVVLSSEPLTDLVDADIHRLVEEIGADQVHVVVTLRPIPSILPSQWQQSVQRGAGQDYESWLQDVFADPPRGHGPTIWRRHRHDRLVRRWADVVGLDRMTVVVVDPADHSAVTRAFDRLVGLPEGTLVPREKANRSLTLGEAEVLRQVNLQLREQGFDAAVQSGIMRYGAVSHIKSRVPDPAETSIVTPAWARQRAWDVARQVTDALEASGVRVVGNLDVLRAEPAAKPVGEPVVTPQIAARAFVGSLLGTQRLTRHESRAEQRTARPSASDEPTTRELVRLLGGRARDRVTRRRRHAP